MPDPPLGLAQHRRRPHDCIIAIRSIAVDFLTQMDDTAAVAKMKKRESMKYRNEEFLRTAATLMRKGETINAFTLWVATRRRHDTPMGDYVEDSRRLADMYLSGNRECISSALNSSCGEAKKCGAEWWRRFRHAAPVLFPDMCEDSKERLSEPFHFWE